MTSKTVVQYTPEQTRSMIDQYESGISVQEIATQMGKTARSVIAKLASQGVYKAKAKVAGDTRVTKAMLVEKIAARLQCDVAEVASLEKADKAALELVASL